jgi:hypothetical protein
MTILLYEFKPLTVMTSLAFSHAAFTWVKDNVSPCRLDIESGRERYRDMFATTLHSTFGLDMTPDIVEYGGCRVKLWKGEGWSITRVFRNTQWMDYPSVRPDVCSFYIWFEQEVVALQFKLSMSISETRVISGFGVEAA